MLQTTKEQTQENNNKLLQDQLRSWAGRNNIKANHLSELLSILHPYLTFLPHDSRTLMNTPRKTNTIKLNNGEMVYVGVLPNLKKKLLNSGFQTPVNHILLQINIDGFPIFKSTSLEFYPILALSQNLNDSNPFTVGLFCGKGKPDPIHIHFFR